MGLLAALLCSNLFAQSPPALPGTPFTEPDRAALQTAIGIYEKAIELAKGSGSAFSESEIKRMEEALESFNKANGQGRVRKDDPGKKKATTHPERRDKRGNDINTPTVGAGGETVTLPPVLVDPDKFMQATAAVVIGHEGERLTADQKLNTDKNKTLRDLTLDELMSGVLAMQKTVKICALDLKVLDALIDYFKKKNTAYWVNLMQHKKAVLHQIVIANQLETEYWTEILLRQG